MRNPSWSRPILAAALAAVAAVCAAQSVPPPVAATAPAPVAAGTDNVGADALADALACRIGAARYPGLMQEIRGERQQDFRQVYRQYSEPMMDLYQLQEPVSAWGNRSEVVVIASNRVMLAVEGSLDEVTARLETALEQSSQSPLSGGLDDQHALLIFEAGQPGLEGMVLLGCEYRIPGASLLEDPADAWRRLRDAPLATPVR
ncbi:MAG: hypothetical protein EOP91_04635 [Lysobacteraceae bacterium]|nr:MAG: hypothetical protein EOP91_04635 [Xanthomonadaceae bacterium]